MDEWRYSEMVAYQHILLAGLEWGPYNELLDRYDYLEAVCLANNALRGE